MNRRKFVAAGCLSTILHMPGAKATGILASEERAGIASSEKLTLCVVGVGQFGAGALVELGPFATISGQAPLTNIRELEFRHICVDRNGKGLGYCPGFKPVLLDMHTEPAVREGAIPEQRQLLSSEPFLASDLVFVVADFDSEKSICHAQILLQHARRLGAFTIALGTDSSGIALKASEADAVLRVADRHAEQCADYIRMIAISAAMPGIIGVDLGDIVYAMCGETLHQKRGILGQIACGAAEGDLRAEVAAATALADLSPHDSSPDGVFVKISADRNSLRIAEISQVLGIVRQCFPERVHLIAACPPDNTSTGLLRVEILTSQWVA